MPIYEYYCEACRGRFSHLARRFDETPPPCPRCSNLDVERIISAPNVVHGVTHHERQLKTDASRVAGDDTQAAAQFLHDSGRLEDADGLYGSRAYKELIQRRRNGATDADLTDLVDDLAAAAQLTPAAELASMVALSDQIASRMGADGPPEGHDHADSAEVPHGQEPAADGGPVRSGGRRAARNLGWG